MSEHLTISADVSLQAAAGKAPRVSITAYSGKPMPIAGFGNVLLAVAGIELGAVPILADHKNEVGSILGHGVATALNNEILVEGELTTATEAGKQVLALAAGGFAFQSSVGLEVTRGERVGEGKTVEANGSTIMAGKGGLFFVRAGVLREVSLTAVAADRQTSVSISAAFSEFQTMDETTLPAVDNTQDLRATRAAELDRVGAIEQLVAKYPGASSIAAAAIRDGRSVEAAELDMLRASRPNHGGIFEPSEPATDQVYAAAVLCHLGASDVAEAEYGAEVTQRGHDLGVRHIADVVASRLRSMGKAAPRNASDLLTASHFSTVGLSGILGDSANKMMLSAYRAFPSVAKQISRKLSAADFKTHTGYRLTGDFQADEVGAAGELKHAIIDEDSFTYSVKTYGRIFGVTRHALVNDDLSALGEIPRMLGRGCAQALEAAFWTLVLANTDDFFGAGNGNLETGAGSALDSTALSAAVQTFLEQTDDDGQPISVLPKWLVCPPALKTTADELYTSRTVNVGGSNASTDDNLPAGNAFMGLYRPLVTPYLSSSSYTGYSNTGWYLFGDPADVAAFGLAYLNGVERPTVEQVEQPGNVLGMAWRGYLDFGVCQVDHRGGVKSNGA